MAAMGMPMLSNIEMEWAGSPRHLFAREWVGVRGVYFLYKDAIVDDRKITFLAYIGKSRNIRRRLMEHRGYDWFRAIAVGGDMDLGAVEGLMLRVFDPPLASTNVAEYSDLSCVVSDGSL